MAKNIGLESMWNLKLATVAKNLEAKNFATTIVGSLAEAVSFFEKKLLPELNPKSIAVGGSETVTHSGAYEIMAKCAGENFYNSYEKGISKEEALNRRRQGLLSDLFVTSTNALTIDGCLVNFDGVGNRVAAICFGPTKVVLFVGRNKICANKEEALTRVRQIAAPANNLRLAIDNPCTKTGSCSDCKSPSRICNSLVYTERSFVAKRIHVILINEDLGY